MEGDLMFKVKFIYNPKSGGGRTVENLDLIIDKYQEKNYTIVPYRISEFIDIKNAFEDIDSSYHHILIAGGDGTINQVINIMKEKNINLPIAILPLGTANDFAKYFDMPQDVEEACDKILNGEIQDIDICKANDKYFINVFSFGFFTDISQKTPTHLKNTIGKLAYYFNGIKEIPTFKKMNILVNSDPFSYSGNAIIFFAFNGKTAGNINIAYKSDISDGLLDLIIIKGEDIKSTILSVFEFLKGEHLENPKDIIHVKLKSFDVKYDNPLITTDIDGEPGPDSPIHIECIKDGLKIIC